MFSRICLGLTALVAAFILVGGDACARDRRSTFHSTDGFSVTSPLGWRQVGSSDAELAVVSGHTTVQGAVIPRGNAEIIIRRITLSANESVLAALTTQYQLENANLRHLPGNTSPSEKTCPPAGVVVGDFMVAPGASQKVTITYCQRDSDLYLVILMFWNTDPIDHHWQDVAMTTMRSLRIIDK
jgi:hypothetical protein